jgi:RNA polymerase sigma-70 factor (ECF subfamily)
LVHNPGAYNEREKFKAGLFTVARNAAMDHFRRETARREVPLPDGEPCPEEEGGGGSPVAAISPEPGPDKALAQKMLAERLACALGKLSEDQRKVFYLRHYSELSFKEIAAMLGLPIGTVLARMSRAAALLRKELEGGDNTQ